MIKDSDYIVTLAPMITRLNLQGHALTLFALIHGFSKDKKTACRTSLRYMAKWCNADKSTVSKVISKLVKAGYINRLEYYEGGVKCFEYTSNYEALLARSVSGEELGLAPSQRVVKKSTVEKKSTVDILTSNGCDFDNETVEKMSTNNIEIIYYNYSFASPAQQEEEKKNFFKNFFKREAADPAAEVERFIAYNNSLGWTNKDGREYDTPEKRLGLAGFWDFKLGKAEGVRLEYMKGINRIVEAAEKMGECADVLLDPRFGIEWDKAQNKWLWKVSPEAKQWLIGSEEISFMAKQSMAPVFKNRHVSFVEVNQN